MSATMSATMPAMSFLDEAWSAIVSIHLEILMFVAATAVYYVLKQRRIASSYSKKSNVVKLCVDEDDCEIEYVQPTVNPRKSLRKVRNEVSDSLKMYDANKQSDRSPKCELLEIVEPLHRSKKDVVVIVDQLKRHLQKHPTQCNMSSINDLLESLGRSLDSKLMEAIVQMLPAIGLRKDKRTYEIFLSMQFTVRNLEQVVDLIGEMRRLQIPFTKRALVICIKQALRMNDFSEALNHFRELGHACMSKEDSLDTTTQAPLHLVAQLVELACKENQLNQMIPDLSNTPRSEDITNIMLTECARLRDVGLAHSVEQLARQQEGAISDITYALLIRAFAAGEPSHARTIIDEVVALRGKHCSPDLVSTVLAFCAKVHESTLPDQMLVEMNPCSVGVTVAFIRFYLETGNASKACDIFEESVQSTAAREDGVQKINMLDPRLERSLLSAALSCGRSSLANTLFAASPSDIAKHLTMIQKCAAEKNLQGAFDIFASLSRSGVDLNSVVYNSVLEACVQCHDFQAAENWMEKVKEAGMADVVSYNTLIKAHLLDRKVSKARALMEEMKQLGLQPNRVTYNELINSIIACRGSKDDMWSIVLEMRDAGIRPNQVTVSILLKHLNSQSSDEDVSSTMDLINSMEEQMDEVLLSSVVEACVRVGKTDLLARKLKELQGSDRIIINGAHTFGSLIKAYGHASDVDGVWRCWKEMRSRHIKPSSITLGCMVEALVRNSDADGAYDLIQQVQEDEQCHGVVNSVTYCSVLKGFTRQRQLDRAWTLYKEMSQKNIEMSVVTYNTLIDACARVGRMEHVPRLLEDMKKQAIQPNLITFSTIIKGHSQTGDIQAAFAVLDRMRQETSLTPDEIMYNSLLDACAQQSLSSEGIRLLEEMEGSGVQPSNYTLSVVVKLMNRSRRVDQAFSLVRDISEKYGFKPNVHVYTNLIQACCSNRQLSRAMSTLETMVQEGVSPENRTYAVLTRASMLSNQPEQAVALLRGALGLHGAHPAVARKACPNIESGVVNDVLNGLVDRGFAKSLAVPLLTDIRAGKQRIRIDSAIETRLMSSSMEKELPWRSNTKKNRV
jgi:pentatricopeptide repeat protein